jgi:hypothetical protein
MRQFDAVLCNEIQFILAKLKSGLKVYGIKNIAVYRGGNGVYTTACDLGNAERFN